MSAVLAWPLSRLVGWPSVVDSAELGQEQVGELEQQEEQAQVGWLEEQADEREAGVGVELAEEWRRLVADLRLRVAGGCWQAAVRWQEQKEVGLAAIGKEGGAMLRMEQRQARKMSEGRAQETRTGRLRLRKLS